MIIQCSYSIKNTDENKVSIYLVFADYGGTNMEKGRCISILFISIYFILSFTSISMAAEEITAIRTIEPSTVEPGDSFQVTVVINSSSEEFTAAGLQEYLPDSWTVTPIDNDEMIYQEKDEDDPCGWLMMYGILSPDSGRTIVYEVQVPETISGGTYSITGEVYGQFFEDTDFVVSSSEVAGDSEVTVDGDLLFTNTDWPQFQSGIYNNGVTSDRAAIQEPDETESWSTYTYNIDEALGIDVQPIVVDDLVYVVANDTVYAVNAYNGDMEWSKNIYVGDTAVLGTPAYGNGKLFVVSFGRVYSFDALTGEELWNQTISSDSLNKTQLNTPVLYNDGKIYFGEWISEGEGDRKYYCYDESGNEVWSRVSSSDEKGYYYAGATIIENSVIYGDDALHITSIDKDDGTLIDEVNVSELLGFGYNGEREEIRASITYSPKTGRIYSVSEAGYCFYIGVEYSGKFDTSDANKVYIGSSTSTPAVYNGRIYVGTGKFTGNHDFYCLNESDLSVIWNYTANGGIQASPVISTAYEDAYGDIYIYFTTNTEDSRVYCFKDSTENIEPDLQWYYQPSEEKNDYTLNGVVIKDGVIYYGNDAGYLFALAEWNPWDDPYSDSEEKLSSDEFQQAIHCWITREGAPTTGATIDGDRIQILINKWLTKS